MLLRLMPSLARVIVLVMPALLVDAGAAHRKLAVTLLGRRNVHALPCRGLVTAAIRHIGFTFQNPQLLFMRFLSLHATSPDVPDASRRLSLWHCVNGGCRLRRRLPTPCCDDACLRPRAS